MNKLIIFDLDGTLVQTYYSDDNSYLSALNEIIPINPNYKYWQDCEHLTDSAIFHHIFQKVENRNPTEEEIKIMQEKFINRLQKKHIEHPAFFEEIPGAVQAMQMLVESNLKVGVATGGWRRIAEFKLQKANFNFSKVKVIGSDEHFSKYDFVTALIEDYKAHLEVDEFEYICYVGDSLYDYRVSRQMGIDFIGVDFKKNNMLKKEGVEKLITDFTDFELFRSQLSF